MRHNWPPNWPPEELARFEAFQLTEELVSRWERITKLLAELETILRP